MKTFMVVNITLLMQKSLFTLTFVHFILNL